jgi:hypothetical protein
MILRVSPGAASTDPSGSECPRGSALPRDSSAQADVGSDSHCEPLARPSARGIATEHFQRWRNPVYEWRCCQWIESVTSADGRERHRQDRTQGVRDGFRGLQDRDSTASADTESSFQTPISFQLQTRAGCIRYQRRRPRRWTVLAKSLGPTAGSELLAVTEQAGRWPQPVVLRPEGLSLG